MNRSQLINAVKGRIDEVSPLTGNVLVDVGFGDGKTIDSVIDSLLDESAQELYMIAPIHYLNVSTITNVAIPNQNDNKIGIVKLPLDYLRIVEFRMQEWERSVFETVLPGSILEKRQSNEFLRGNISLPVVVMKNNSDGNYYEYYSVNTDHTIKINTYIKKEPAENAKETLQASIVLLTASKYFLMNGMIENAKLANESAIKLLLK